jgi:hypothetical protein
MAVRNADAKPFASPRPSIGARHVGRSPGFVDENEALGIQIGLVFKPVRAPLQDVRAILRAGVRSLFSSDAAAIEEALERADAEATALLGEPGLTLLQRDVDRFVRQRHDQTGQRLDATGMTVAAPRFSRRASRIAIARASECRSRRSRQNVQPPAGGTCRLKRMRRRGHAEQTRTCMPASLAHMRFESDLRCFGGPSDPQKWETLEQSLRSAKKAPAET